MWPRYFAIKNIVKNCLQKQVQQECQVTPTHPDNRNGYCVLAKISQSDLKKKSLVTALLYGQRELISSKSWLISHLC